MRAWKLGFSRAGTLAGEKWEFTMHVRADREANPAPDRLLPHSINDEREALGELFSRRRIRPYTEGEDILLGTMREGVRLVSDGILNRHVLQQLTRKQTAPTAYQLPHPHRQSREAPSSFPWPRQMEEGMLRKPA
jgi:hypothetical protein